MSYTDAQRYLDALGIDSMKALRPSTHRIEALLEALDHPESHLQAIHITGTNGKGSTARIATALLSASGLSVGTYTSPHLESMTERISIDNAPISEDVFSEVFEHVLPFAQVVESRLSEKVSYFELLTAMFFLWASENVDVAVVEVGLGGRWDATNVVTGQVGVITNIGIDHIQQLGTDRKAIASEKAGIVKPGMRVVTGERDPEIVRVIESRAEECGADLLVLDKDFALEVNDLALGGRYLEIRTSGGRYEDLFLPLHGRHQGTNASLALEAVVSFLPAESLSREVVAEGMGKVTAPGRLESLPGEPLTVLDVAHNPEGMSAVVNALQEAFAFERVVFVVGILADKDRPGMLTELRRVPHLLVATEPSFGRATPADELVGLATDLGVEAVPGGGIEAAVRLAQSEAGPGDLICITGSHYVVGDARRLLRGS